MTIRVDSALLFGIRLGIFLLLLMPLVVTPSTLFPYVVGKSIYARSLIEVIFAGWLILVMRDPSYRTPRSWVLWLFGIFLFASLISAMVGVSFQRSFWGDFRRMGGVFDLAHWFAFAVVLVSVLKDGKQWRWLLNANLGVSLLVALLGLAQYYDVRVFEPIFWYLQPTGPRVDVTFGNATYVGAYMLVNVLVALAFLAHTYELVPQPLRRQARRSRRRTQRQGLRVSLLLWRAFWIITAVLGLWVLTLSGTRGAVVGLVVGLLIAGVAYVVWGRWRRLKLVAGALTATLLLLFLVAPAAQDTAPFQDLARSNVLARRLDTALSRGIGASYESRLVIARTGLEAFIHAPVLGWGPENFAVASDRYFDASDFPMATQLADQAHNKPIEVLAATGMVGFAAYALLLGRMIWVLARTARRESAEQLFALFMGTAVVAYLVQDLFLFDTPATFLQFILLLGWVAWSEGFRGGAPADSMTESRPGSSDPAQSIAAGRGGSSSSRHPKRGARQQWDVGSGISWLRTWMQDGALRQRTLVNAAIVLVIMLVGGSLYFLNYLPYRAAQIYPLQGTSLEQFLAQAQRSFQTFPPLATLGRQVLFDTLSEHWEDRNESAESLLLDQLQLEGEAALKSEPQNARLYLGLARVYQRAGTSQEAYLPVAKSYVGNAQRLAPSLLESTKVFIAQEVAEGKYGEALRAIQEYASSDPAISLALSLLRDKAQAGLIEQIGWREYYCRWVGKEDITPEERARIQCEEAYYQTVLEILGPAGVILPLIDPDTGDFDATIFTTMGGEELPFTWSAAPGSFDTPPGSKGAVLAMALNGTDENADTPDADYWSRGDSASDSAFSVGAWVNLSDATPSVILAKADGATAREWIFEVDGANRINLVLYDESEDAYIGRNYDAAITENVWYFAAATYDGRSASAGVRIYLDGVQVDNANTQGGVYTAMENLVTPPSLASYHTAGRHFQGAMAGGPLGPFFTHKKLSADEVAQLYQLGQALLELQ